MDSPTPPPRPTEDDWQHAEKLAAEIDQLPKEEIEEKRRRLMQEGAPTVADGGNGHQPPWPPPGPPPPPPPSPEPGWVLAERYTLREVIGEGGMGKVWRATQKLIERDVAVKVIHPALSLSATMQRFRGEMEILGRLEHPGIVRIFDADIHRHEESGVSFPFFAMELVDGVPLHQWGTQHRSDGRLLLDLMAEVCAAVQYAHDRQIVHRDLKPSNVLVRGNGQPVVLDFGISRLIGGGPEEIPGAFMGTPTYAAPEQHLGRDRDFRSGESVDVYATGAILFELLAKRRLFEFPPGTRLADMRRRILEDPLPRLREAQPQAAPVLEEITLRALARDPAERYFSMAALGRALRRAARQLHGPAKPEPPPWIPTAGALIPGTQWALEQKLGAGATGEVWLGTHQELTERGVFKFCDTEEKVRSLKRELALYRLLKERVGRNPHFIPLHEVALEEPPWYLRMEHVDAVDLPAWCAQQPSGLKALSLETKVEIVAQAAEALQAAHEAGLLHRDIKPANLLIGVVAGGMGPHVYVADFGIGQIVTEHVLRVGATFSPGTTLADLRTGSLSGTVMYLAPEILEGQAATARSDVYSLGVILWQLLHGNLNAALDHIKWAERVADPLLVEDLRRCLAGAPEDRWASAGALAASLRALAQRRTAEKRRLEEAVARERVAYWKGVLRASAFAAAILLAVTLLAVLAWQQRRDALRARAASALEQAEGIAQRDMVAGRRAKGLALLDPAAEYPSDRVRLRSVALSLLALPDLESCPITPPPATVPSLPTLADATAVGRSPDGRYLAAGRARDALSGKVEFLNGGGKILAVADQENRFPWVPIPEPEFLRFSPDSSMVAVAGPATSNHILLYQVPGAKLASYIFHGSGLTCLAWHPGGRLLASGRDDRLIRLWNREPAPAAMDLESYDDLPEAQEPPAIDLPAAVLRGHRDRILSIAFPKSGEWMASLDGAGWLRIWNGEGAEFLPLTAGDGGTDLRSAAGLPALTVEMKLDFPAARELRVEENQVQVHSPSGPLAAYAYGPGPAYREALAVRGQMGMAWDGAGERLCVIADGEVHWLERDAPQMPRVEKGSHPVAVAWDARTQRWALPEIEHFLEKTEPEADEARKVDSAETSPGTERASGRSALASTALGRMALYHAHQIQLLAEPELEALKVSAPGILWDLVWDREGRLLTVLHQDQGGLRAESWQTEKGAPQRLKTVSLPRQRVVSAEDGKHLLGRSVANGLQWIDATTGAVQLLDGGAEAKQDAALAVSADGQWIAAVVDRWQIRLLKADGTHYATLRGPSEREITHLAWAPSGEWLAAGTSDGYVEIWSLGRWREWLAGHGLTN